MAENHDARERKDLEIALIEQATQLRTAQRIARLGAFVFDVRTGQWTSSEMLDEIFGIAGLPFVYNVEGWISLLHPEDRAAMQAYLIENVIGRGERFDREYRIIRRSDGADRWVHGCGELTFGSDGRPTQLIGTIQDCTERHASERALRAANTRLTEMFDRARDAVFLADTTTGVLLDLNRAASILVGRPKEELIGLHQTELHPPELRDVYRARFQEHLRNITQAFEGEVFHADGHRIPVEVAASFVPLPDGRQAIQGIFRDITQRKAAEGEILRREARLASVFRAVPVGIFVVAERKFLQASPYVAQLVGYQPEELIGRSVRLLYPTDEEFERVGREAYPAIRDAGECRLETVWCHRDGRRLEILLSAAAIGHEGEHGAITFAALDVTERRRLEAQLRQAQKMEAIGQLAGGVAHDFNNILTTILLQMSHLKQDTDLGAERLEAIDDVLRCAHRAADLTRQLLAFSRQQVMRKQTLDLNKVISGLLRMLERVLGENIEIRFRPADEPAWIEGDPGMLEQVLMNLCINARDAMPHGGTLTLTTQHATARSGEIPVLVHGPGGACVKLIVSDTGTGIPEAILGRIFEPFFTTKDVGRGTGLGLATVLGIVEQHQGWITVDSKVGSGTTFTSYLPAASAPSVTPPPETGGVHSNRGTGTILLVEDEDAVRRSVSALLRRHGYVVLEASRSEEALTQWAHNAAQIDLLIADFIMPGTMSGLDLCRHLANERPELPAILLSGYSPSLIGRSVQESDRIVYVAKPCDGPALERIVVDLLAGKPQPRR